MDSKEVHLEKPYKILTENEIRQLIDNDISTVSGVLSISRGAACSLLCRSNWNLTSVYDKYFASAAAADDDQNPQFSSNRKLGQLLECNICYDELSSQNTFSAACGHPYCSNCWKTYLETAIADGARCLTLTCPAPGCAAAAGVDLVDSLASLESREKFYKYLRRSYVESSRRRKWCPAAGCGFAVEFDGGTAEFDVTCRCSHKFCWNCAAEHHRPVDCETVAIWTEKNKSEAAAWWIAANTKPCPKCRRPIEKNQGCNTMKCRSPCNFRFCWLCGQPAASHFACNEYWSPNGDKEHKKAKKSVISRHAHYYERWHANEQSREVAMADLRRWRECEIEKLGEMQGEDDASRLGFAVKAWEQIVECRRVLKWSYAYGYFIKGEGLEKAALFEYLQGEAEAGLERLHRCAEKEMKRFLLLRCREEFEEFRGRVINLTVVTKNYFENLVKAMENNLAEVVGGGGNGGKGFKEEGEGYSMSDENINPRKRAAV